MAKKLTDEERAVRDTAKKEAAAKKAAELQKQGLEVIPPEVKTPKVKTAKRFSKVPDKDELLADYNNIQRAMANDKEALAIVEAKYGKINNPGDLAVLSTHLYARITGNEKNVADTQAEIEGRHAAHSKK